jgi:hydroxyethylthiazole kinase
MNSIAAKAGDVLMRLRETRPLINHITNFVVMNDTANVTLFVGGQPVMGHALAEVAEMTALAGALVLNSGNVTFPDWCEAMIVAGLRANEQSIPIVLDPVGAGATSMRTRGIRRILHEVRTDIIRGNAGEIGILSGMGGKVRGVDSVEAAGDPAEVASHMARGQGNVVVISGKSDTISDGSRVVRVENGHEWLTTLTGTGCMATTVIAAFAAVERDYVVAGAAALAMYGLAAEMAAEEARGPASFRVALFDYLYQMTPEQLASGARIVAG